MEHIIVAVAASVKKPVGYVTKILDPVGSAFSVVKVAVAPFLTAPGVADGMRNAVVVVIPADTAGKNTGIHTEDVAPMLDLPTVITSDSAFVLAEKVRPLMVMVKGVLPVVAGILAPVTVKVMVLAAKEGVTRAAPTLNTSMPVD